MESLTYRNCKKLIESGNFVKDDIMNKIDIFFLGDRITKEEYENLMSLVKSE